MINRGVYGSKLKILFLLVQALRRLNWLAEIMCLSKQGSCLEGLSISVPKKAYFLWGCAVLERLCYLMKFGA